VIEQAVLISAAVPALLLARSVTGRGWAAAAAGAGCVAAPWLLLEPIGRSEALSYAAFLWALLALYRAVVAPGLVNDGLALAAIALASLAHGQLLLLLVALPVAVVLHERSPVLAAHPLLVVVYPALLVVAGLQATGLVGGGERWQLVSDSLPRTIVRASVEHAAALGLWLAIAPLVLAVGWVVSNLARPVDARRGAFAAVGVVTLALVVVTAASLDVRFANDVRERYLVYALPVVVLALVAAVAPPRRPRWSLTAAVLTWLGFGLVLSRITGRITDWFVMTDELLYERLAISIANTESPLPQLRGELVENVNQLYPLVLSRVYETGLIPDSLHDAHVLNAFAMTSALVPAYLLARSVTRRNGVAFGVAVVTASVPWLTLSSFLLTEAVAYPAFLWALFAAYRAMVVPRPLNDVLALVAIGVAVLARVQLLVLLVVFPLALLLHERGRVFRRHPVVLGAYAVLAVGAAVLSATVGLSSALGIYSITVEGFSLAGLPRAIVEHVAPLALTLAILPFLVAVGWLLRTIVRPREPSLHAFASLALVSVTVVTVQVAYFDQRFGEQFPWDRYLFYLVPVLLVALGCALLEPPWPGWSLLAPAALVAASLALSKWPRFEKLNFQAPLATLNDPIVELSGGSVEGARLFGVLATLVLVLLFVEGARRVARPVAAGVLVAAVALAVPAETGYAFWRLFAVPGTAGRSLTHDQAGVFNWVDRAVGPDADVTMVPYPHLQADYWSAVAFWWDLEFWNRSVVRAAGLHGEFQETPRGRTFALRWDGRGVLNVSPTRYAAQLIRDSRFRIAGKVVWTERETDLIDAGSRWRLVWASNGLYEDGWTKPDEEARITVFPEPGHRGAVTRFLALTIEPAGAERVAIVDSTLAHVSTAVSETVPVQVRVCVRPERAGVVRLNVLGAGSIPGNPVNSAVYAQPRSGGLHIRQIVLAAETVRGCDG
jgi:hypothetical protein